MNKRDLKLVEIFCKQIKAKRLSKGWTQQQLADEARICRTTISNLEQICPANIPSFVTAIKIAKVLDISLDKICKHYFLIQKA